MKVYLNSQSIRKGGPKVWFDRFSHGLSQRGFQVTHNLDEDWAAALFVINTHGMKTALKHKSLVGYRVAMGYHPLWFDRMERRMQKEHYSANASIAQGIEQANVVIYQSKWAKETLDNILISRHQDYAIIYNGVDLQIFCPSTALPLKPPVIGCVGFFRYAYRLETFFEASRLLETPHRLLVVGNTDLECGRMLQKYQADPQIGARLTYYPYVMPKNLPNIYQQMSLLIHPVCGDACPNVVVESLACGVPVVAPRFGGTAEIIGNGGVVFDCQPWVYDDNFVTALSQATQEALNQIEVLSHQARQRAEATLDIQRMVSGYLLALGLPEHSPLPFHRQGATIRQNLRQLGSRWVTQPRYYLALALRKAQTIRRKKPLLPGSKPRLAFTLFDFHIGGIESWLYRLACELQGQFEFYFLATEVPQPLTKFQEIGTFAYLPTPAQMVRFLGKHRIDIVQVHNQRWPIDAALAAGVPHIIERTDGTRSCARVPKHGLSLVIASTKGTIPLIAKHFPEDRIRLVYNGVDLDEVDNAIIERPWPSDMFVIGRVSRFGRGKNLGMLINATRKLLISNPTVMLVLIGGDSLIPGAEAIELELRQQATDLGDKVAFLGVKENPIPWIKGFDLATCVSNAGNEGIPNSLMEAMACGKPVISTDIDQVGELIEDGVNGLLIPAGDVDALVNAVERLIQQPAYCQQLGEAARKTIQERFSLKQAARQYAEIYRQLLEGR